MTQGDVERKTRNAGDCPRTAPRGRSVPALSRRCQGRAVWGTPERYRSLPSEGPWARSGIIRRLAAVQSWALSEDLSSTAFPAATLDKPPICASLSPERLGRVASGGDRDRFTFP